MRKPIHPCANNKGSDQPAQMRSLISAFVVRCLDSIIPLFAVAEISKRVSSAEHAGLSLTWPQTPKTGFLVRGAHFKVPQNGKMKHQHAS